MGVLNDFTSKREFFDEESNSERQNSNFRKICGGVFSKLFATL
ncbi:hypothetical protein RintRC_7312 [Richelia intracellularis]|nr:hypothetical protein RintRC_7312 [Richelia intracellularis]